MRPAWVPGLFIIVSIDSSPPFWNIYDGYPIPPKIVSLRKACELWVCDILPNSSTSWSREFWTAFTMKVCWLNWLLKSASIFSSNDLNSPGTNASITEVELRSQKFGCSAWSTVPRESSRWFYADRWETKCGAAASYHPTPCQTGNTGLFWPVGSVQ